MPLIFLLAGIFFIVPIVGGDACLSIEDVGYQYLFSPTDTCDKFSGDGTNTACMFTVLSNSTNAPNISFTLNLPHVYSAVLGGCNPAADPLSPFYDAIRVTALDWIPRELDTQVSDRYGEGAGNSGNSDGIILKKPLTDVIHRLGVGLGNTSSEFVTNMHHQLSCDTIHTVYSSAKSAFCCDVMTSVYWMIASWYWIGWTFLCCGCSAAILGRKRFPHELWGAAVLHDRDELLKNEGGDEFQVDGDHGSGGMVAVIHHESHDSHGGMMDGGGMPMQHEMVHDDPQHHQEGIQLDEFNHSNNFGEVPQHHDEMPASPTIDRKELEEPNFHHGEEVRPLNLNENEHQDDQHHADALAAGGDGHHDRDMLTTDGQPDPESPS